ncbi:hypothetical protein FCV25MIE_19373 [Fagus crenata]
MAEVASLPMDKSYSKTLREDVTIFMLQENHNDRGRFLTVTTYGGLRHKVHVVIPADCDMWGWRGSFDGRDFSEDSEGVTVPPMCESQGETHRVGMSSISDTLQAIGVSTLSREVED